MADPVSIADSLIFQNRSAVMQANGNIDSDPEQAARAMELSAATGVNPGVIHADVEGFERTHKAAMASDIIRNNPYIADYVNSHPLASSISNDDYGNLDKVSGFVQNMRVPSLLGPLTLKQQGSVAAKAISAFKEGVGDPKLGSWMLQRPQDREFIEAHPWVLPLGAALGLPIELPGKIISGGLEALRAGAQETAQQLGMDESSAQRFARDLAGMAEYKMLQTPHAEMPPKVMETARAIKPWIDVDREPPVGLHPEIDKAKLEQTRTDLKTLDDAFKASQQSATRERNPEMFANFIRQHTDAEISVSGDAVRALYGDKPPKPGDNILGWLPDIEDQLRFTEQSGGDIHIPLADWLAKADPEVAKALKDDIRVRPGGVTLNEMKEVPEAPTPPAADLVDSLRTAYSLDPKGLPPSRLILERNVSQGEYHNFHITDETGKQVGTASFTEENGGKNLYVNFVGGANEKGFPRDTPNAFGMQAMRGLLAQVQKEFPQAETISGERVSGARMASGAGEGKVSIPLRTATEVDLKRFTEALTGGEWASIGLETEGYVKPRDLYTENEKALVEAVDETLNRIAPGAEPYDVHAIRKAGNEGFNINGVFMEYRDRPPIIMWALDGPDALGTARHEAIHALKRGGFFTDAEWETLARAARDGKWIRKHQIDVNYDHLPIDKQLEEAIAEEYGKVWSKNPENVSKAAAKVFEKLHMMLVKLKEALETALGRKGLTSDDLFEKVESGEIGARQGAVPEHPEAFREAEQRTKQPELPGTRRMEDTPAFATAPVGMTVKQAKLYEKRIKEDLARQAKIAMEEATRRQGQEWKENEARIRKEVEADTLARPDVAADNFFRTSMLYGDKLKTKPKLAEDLLTPEQRAALPPEYWGKGGMAPDDVAGLFGYQTGDQLVQHLAELVQARGDAQPKAFLDQYIRTETERRMQKEYGTLQENVIEEAKEYILGQTQLDLLHEDYVRMGTLAGVQLPLKQADIKAAAKREFDKLPIRTVDSDALLASAGRAGRAMEDAFLKGDYKEAFKQSQRQNMAAWQAKEAMRIEKEQGQFDRLAKRMSERTVPTVEQEYTNFVHDILSRIGKPIRRSLQDLQNSIEKGTFDSLEDFVSYKQSHDLREVPVADFLLDPTFRKDFNDLSVEEFRAVNDSIKTLVKNGRDEKKILKAGEEADLEAVKSQMIEQLQQFKEKHYDPEGKRWLGPIPPWPAHKIRTYVASHLQLEALFNRWDRGDPRGVFSQYIMRDLAASANRESALERKYSKMLADLTKYDVNLDERVPNSIFKSPLELLGGADPDTIAPMALTRKHLRAILQNVGNASNLDKLARGYGVKPEAIMQWLDRYAKKEDWDWAQAQGDIFAELKKESDAMYRRLSGIEPESVEIEPFSTSQGDYAGWYHPVVYHPLFKGDSKKLMGKDPLEQDGYYRATPAKGYTMKRTGYAAPLSLSLDDTPIRMRQMIHDIAMRESVLNAGKVFYDKSIYMNVAKHYGKEYADLLIPYLQDVANSSNYRSDAQWAGSQVLELARQNVIATLIGFNPGTVMKHGPTALVNSVTEVGGLNFLKAVRGVFGVNEATGDRNYKFAFDNSEELQRRARHYVETLGGAQNAVLGKSSLREDIIALGAKPVALSDYASAVPTWLAQYEKSIKEGVEHGDAVYDADRAVRRAHGSTAITNRPGIARQSGALGAWMTSLYGFFSHIMNRQYEMGWRAKETLEKVGAGEYAEATKDLPKLTGMLFSYVVFPAIIEELVTPLSNDDRESWGKKSAKMLTFSLSSSWVGIRDVVSAALHGRDPSAGLLATGAKMVTDMSRDLSRGKEAFDRYHAGALIQHTATAIGGLAGVTNAQEGRVARFMYNLYTGQERPKGPWQYLVGLRFGQTKGHTQTFDDFLKHPL